LLTRTETVSIWAFLACGVFVVCNSYVMFAMMLKIAEIERRLHAMERRCRDGSPDRFVP
jgi:hypothetical protein